MPGLSSSEMDIKSLFCVILLFSSRIDPGILRGPWACFRVQVSGTRAQRTAVRSRGAGEGGRPTGFAENRTQGFMHMISDEELVAWQQQPLPPSIQTPQAACNVW